ncbi:hypothetical protein BG10_902 [Bacillus thuringiensis serovar morrisoni]|nr:hypothetical protein BG10_902 [Bacillus thuringiensis serovar morrisoni]
MRISRIMRKLGHESQFEWGEVAQIALCELIALQAKSIDKINPLRNENNKYRRIPIEGGWMI